MKSHITAIACAIALSCVPALALAQPSENDKAVAQSLFDAARKLTADKKWAEACPKLAESQRLDPSLGTEYYLADCYEQIGKLSAAQVRFLEVVGKARAAGQTERADFAKKRADALALRIPKLTINVSDEAKRSDGLVVTRDEVNVTEVQWGVPILVELGKHVIVATARNGKRWEQTIDVSKEGATVAVTIPSLDTPSGVVAPPIKPVEPPKAAPPPPPKAAPPPPKATPTAPPAAPPDKPSGMSGQRIAGIAIGAAGVVGLGIGGAFGAIALSKNSASTADGHCDAQNFCDATGKQARLAAFSAATVSTIGFIAGGVALAGGVVLFVTAPKKKAAPKTSTALEIGPGSVSIVGRW